jgi:prolipoprotein diacylglyceryltransferase
LVVTSGKPAARSKRICQPKVASVPDANRGYLLFDWLTMGQILSLPMIVAGLWMIAVAYRRHQPSGNYA